MEPPRSKKYSNVVAQHFNSVIKTPEEICEGLGFEKQAACCKHTRVE